jgi:hypothetical protein
LFVCARVRVQCLDSDHPASFDNQTSGERLVSQLNAYAKDSLG